MIRKALRRFSGSHAPYFKAPHLSAQSIWINVENPSGQIERVSGRIGDSLFSALIKNRSSIGGSCFVDEEWNMKERPVEPNADSPLCALCMIEVAEPWYSQLGKPQESEAKTLVEKPDYPVGFNRRFACSIGLEAWMDEITVRVPYHLLPDNNLQ